MPFFDNLVAKGWLAQAQTRLQGKRQAFRLELLLTFGYDSAGAVSVLDSSKFNLSTKLIDTDQAKNYSC